MSLTITRTRVLLLAFILSTCSSISGLSQTNDTTGAPLLTSVISCSIPSNGNPNYSLDMATQTTGIPAGCVTGGNGTHYDKWFRFSALSTTETVTIGNFGTKITNPETQIFSAALINQACGATSATASGLTVGAIYYVRIANVGSDPSGNGTKPKFDLCITHTLPPPANDDCSNATTLTYGVAKTSETVSWATNSGVAVTPCSGVADDDVWYKFVATSTSAAISLSSLGSNLTSSGVNVQVFSGSCGSLTSIGCGNTTVTVNSLTTSPATTYYVRIYSTGSGNIATAGDFGIIVTDPNALSSTNVTAGRMNEVFKQTILSGSGGLQYPWEITYGPDNMLWITEARGYKVDRMDPNTGTKTTVLDLNSASSDLTAWGADSLRAVNLTSTSNWNASASNWPQGGLAGLALHPKFLDGTGLHDYVYVSYVHRYLTTLSGSGGIYFRNKIVRFTYNSVTQKLGSPSVVCDTIPGGQDHNSQRMIIAPVGGTYYLFYAAGDMGAGQFSNRLRPENAQHPECYDGKILRFNLESDGESGADGWIPNGNPYSGLVGKQSAVYSIGIRNNQGFAYDTATGNLYGASHGPYSDDEINIIESFRNYGHPLIEGFVDGNYNGNSIQGTSTSYSAGAGFTDNSGASTCPPIGNEATNKTTIDASGNGLYKDPLFSAYPAPAATVANIWTNEVGGNPTSPIPWPTEAWSGLDIYNNTLIPGWKHSLVAASLKLGRLVKLKLGAAGTTTMPNNNASDTITYFNSRNRFRDLAFSPNGRDIFVVMDNSSTTSGPGSANPVVPDCLGCVHKYSFLGYNVNSGSGNRSYIPSTIPIANGIAGSFQTANKVVINASNGNNNLWVPITDINSNVVAEINARGYNLDTVTTTLLTRTGASRSSNGSKYVNRNMTIKPQHQPADSVWIRLYISKAEFDQYVTDGGAGSISQLKIIKNEDSAKMAITLPTTLANTTVSEIFSSGNSYVLQGTIGEFSSFYFSNSAIIPLPLNLVTFKGSLQNGTTLLEWQTANEINTSNFTVERSTDGRNFQQIGTVAATGNAGVTNKYSYTDYDVTRQSFSVVYYRLKVVDIDGSYTYSDIVTITLPFITSRVALFPNPAAHEVNVTITTAIDGKVKWQLIDNAGRIVIHNSIAAKKGNNNIVINLNRLSTGTYFLIVSGSDIDQKVKLEKL